MKNKKKTTKKKKKSDIKGEEEEDEASNLRLCTLSLTLSKTGVNKIK